VVVVTIPEDAKEPLGLIHKRSFFDIILAILDPLRCYMLEMLFPNSDQRNTWESLSKAKRKVLLLQESAATHQSLIGRTH
jgi:hypothetical protein